MSVVSSNNNFYTNISPLIKYQFPEIYETTGEMFIEFVKEYYNWLHQPSNVGYLSRTNLKNRNIDNVDPSNLPELFLSDFLLSSNTVPGNPNLYLKHIIDLYTSKGSPESFSLLFKMLYNVDVQVEQPGYDMMSLNNGIWYQPNYIEVYFRSGAGIDTVKELLTKNITGTESKASAIITDFNIINVNNKQMYVLYIDQKQGNFFVGEELVSDDVFTNIFVKGSLSYINIYSGGDAFNIGDLLQINSSYGFNGSAEVVSVRSLNGSVNFQIVDGGYGYGNNATISISSKNGIGTGATFKIGTVSNATVFDINTDNLAAYQNTALNSNSYGFPVQYTTNINSVLDTALTYYAYEVGTISTLSQINPGTGYTEDLVISVNDPIVSALKIPDGKGSFWGEDALINGIASVANGVVTAAKVTDSGFNFINNEEITLFSNNNSSLVKGYTGVSGVGTSIGSWVNNKNLVSSTSKLTDDLYYQKYSYVISCQIPSNVYDSVLDNNLHPVGYKRFSKNHFSDAINSSFTSSATVSIS